MCQKYDPIAKFADEECVYFRIRKSTCKCINSDWYGRKCPTNGKNPAIADSKK